MSEINSTILYTGITILFVGLVVFFMLIPKIIYGTWVTIFDTGCNNNDSGCLVKGTQTIIQQCNPGPSNSPCITEKGLITYKNQVLTSSCTPICQNSNWVIEEGPCKAYNLDNTLATGCFNVENMIAQQQVTQTCIFVNPTGINNCIEFDDLTQTTKTYDIGQTIKSFQPCVTPQNPLCGEWVIYNGDSVTDICQVNNIYIETSDCVATGALSEGFFTVQMACEVEDKIIIPLPSDPPLLICPKIPCTNTPITPSMKIPENPVICANNPQCLQICRLFPSPNMGDPSFNNLVNKVIILTHDSNNNVITAFNIPRNPSSPVKFDPPPENNDSNSSLPSVSLISTSTTFNTSKCSKSDVIFNTGILMQLAPISGTKVNIFLTINSEYFGWLGKDVNNVATWDQAIFVLNGPGLTKAQAQVFNVITNGTVMSITDFNNIPIVVIDDNNVNIPLTNMNINLFSPDLNYTVRDISPCNKLI